MAVVTETCLELSTEWVGFPGQQCRQESQQGDRFSVLETKLVCYKFDEGPRSLDLHLPGSMLSLDPSGFLEVVEAIQRGGLLIRWRPQKSILGKARAFLFACEQHSELMEDNFLGARSFGLYVVARNPGKLPPVECTSSRKRLTPSKAQEGCATDHELDHNLKVPPSQTAYPCIEPEYTAGPSHRPIVSSGGADVVQEEQEQRYVQPSIDRKAVYV